MTYRNIGNTRSTATASYSTARRLDVGLRCGMMLAVLAAVGACGGAETPGTAEQGGSQGVGGSGTKATTTASTSTSSSATGGATQTNTGGTSAVGTTVTTPGGNTSVTSAATGGVNGNGGSAATGGTKAGGGFAATGGTKAGGGGSAATGGSKAAGGSAATGGAVNGGGGNGGAVNGGAVNGGAVNGGAVNGGAVNGGAVNGGAVNGGAVSGGNSNTSTGPIYNPDFVEFSGADCKVTEPKDGKVSTLDDLFVNGDGARMTKKSDWRCQRAYLKRVVEKYIHGDKPGTPDKVTGTVSKTSIAVHVEHKGKTVDFSVSVSLPSGASGPVPIVIGLGGVSSGGGTASLPDTITKEGVATSSYDHNKISDEASRSGLFSNIYGTTNASAQIGWAWGISRVIDVLVAEKAAGRNSIIDPTAVGVTGCSRNGKGAFTVGAFDERIALGIPQESGTGGVTALKMIASAPKGPNGQPAQSVSSAMSTAAGWFGTVFNSYSSKLNSIPGDMHSLAAMYAPRGLIVIDNARIGELCSTCQHGASAAAQKVYEALGIGKNIEYHGGLPADPQPHCSFNTEQVEPLQRAIRAFLTKKAAPNGKMEPQSVGTADLTKWITWTAPTLEDDMSWDSPPLTSE